MWNDMSCTNKHSFVCEVRYCLFILLYTHIDQTLVNSLHRMLNCEIGGLDRHAITTEYRTRVHCIHLLHLFCNAFVHVIYSGVYDQYSHSINLIVYHQLFCYK